MVGFHFQSVLEELPYSGRLAAQRYRRCGTDARDFVDVEHAPLAIFEFQQMIDVVVSIDLPLLSDM